MNYSDDKAYAFEACDMRALEKLRQRLYADKLLSGDERRDLANALDALLHKAVEVLPTQLNPEKP
jgi:hypothetical protein